MSMTALYILDCLPMHLWSFFVLLMHERNFYVIQAIFVSWLFFGGGMYVTICCKNNPILGMGGFGLEFVMSIRYPNGEIK